MKIVRCRDYEEMSRRTAAVIAAQLVLKPDSILGLATGSTPIGTYQELIRRYRDGEIDFSEVRTANLDEYRGLDRESEQSYYYFMRDQLFGHVNIREENTHIPDGREPDADRECSRYDDLLSGLGGVDIQLLGLGHNGHIGFNEPASEFPKGVHCVDLTESTIEANQRFFARREDVPTQAYTMGIQNIMSAKRILIIVSGADKAAIVNRAFFGPVTPEVPASILQLHPDVWLLGDEAALADISSEV